MLFVSRTPVRTGTARARSASGSSTLNFSNPSGSVVFSADGKTLLISFPRRGPGGVISYEWDAIAGEIRSPQTVFEDYSATSAVFSPDDKMVMTTRSSGEITLWDSHDGCRGRRNLAIFRHKAAFFRYREGTRVSHYFNGAIFSPDGRWILSTGLNSNGGWDRGEGLLWAVSDLLAARRDMEGIAETAPRSVFYPPPSDQGGGGGFAGAVFSPEGREILCAHGDSGVYLWPVPASVEACGNEYKVGVSPGFGLSRQPQRVGVEESSTPAQWFQGQDILDVLSLEPRSSWAHMWIRRTTRRAEFSKDGRWILVESWRCKKGLVDIWERLWESRPENGTGDSTVPVSSISRGCSIVRDAQEEQRAFLYPKLERRQFVVVENENVLYPTTARFIQ